MPPKLNILFMTENFKDTVCINAHYHLEQAIGQIARCRWAGPGHPNHKPGEPLSRTVKRVMKTANWVIYYDFGVAKRNIMVSIPPKTHKRRYNVAAYVGDLHREPQRYVRRLNEIGWDAVLMAYTQLGKQVTYSRKRYRKPIAIVDIQPNYFTRLLKIPHLHMAPNINPDVFKPSDKPKLFDATFLGAVGLECYPLRGEIWEKLPFFAKKNGWKILLQGTPPGRSLDRKISELQPRYYVGDKYVEALGRSKVFIFGTSVFKYPLLKFFEAMACGACVMADVPLTAEELHFIPDRNFVAINKNNWKEKLKYYLEHDEEREEIARRGYETVMAHHTTNVRARQVVNFLRESM